MSTRTPPSDRTREDRLERLLRAGEEDLAVEDRPVDLDPDEEWQDLLDRVVRGRHRLERVPLLSVPESLRSSELQVGVRAVRGLLVLVVVAVLVLGGRWLWTQRVAVASPPDRVVTGQPAGGHDTGAADRAATGEGGAVADQAAEQPDDAVEQEGGSASQVGAESSGAGPDGAARSGDLVVHVAGEVAEPGVVAVPAGSRVVDAVRAAGGVTDAADQSTLNLARPLLDGERVWVGRPGETPPVAPGPLPGPAGAPAGPAAPLDLNAATQADLEELPGVGPVTAGHILTWREEHGRFSSVEELLEVSGIGERTLAQLEPLVTVGG